MIIAGFGGFGSTVGRLLKASGVPTTVLEYDSDRVDLLRRLGLKVYYGDATRYDDDMNVYLSEARRRIENLERIMRADREEPGLDRDAVWDAESLREEVRTGAFTAAPPPSR